MARTRISGSGLFQRLRKLWSITALRLTLLYSLTFGAAALGLIIYVTSSSIHLLKKQVSESIIGELRELDEIYQERGLNGTIIALEVRSRAPGANLYVVASPAGQILAGNVLDLETGVLDKVGWTYRPFRYSRFGDTENQDHRAMARIVELPNGMRLLIGRDIGEPEQFGRIISNALALALGSMVVMGLLAWFFVGRRMLKRVDLVSKSTDRIMSGDREERLPVTGSGDEFDRLSGRMNTMLDRINLLDEGLKQVSDNIAHDLKTPLTRIRNSVEASLAIKGENGKHRQALEEVLTESENLIKTFNAMLMISRVESGSAAAKMDPQNISEILNDLVELYEPAAEEQNFELEANIEEGLIVSGSRELLSQMISNLIDNALKYGKSGENDHGTIRVEAARQGKHVVLSVMDRGIGIPDTEKDKVTDRFYRLEKSRNLPGSGLGLALVKAIVTMHSAELTLKDRNPGLSVIIKFPES